MYIPGNTLMFCNMKNIVTWVVEYMSHENVLAAFCESVTVGPLQSLSIYGNSLHKTFTNIDNR